MTPRLSERARRLVDAINLLWAGRGAAAGLEALFTADETEIDYDELHVDFIHGWLVENLPELWYRESPARVREVAVWIAELDRGYWAGVWGPG